MESINCEESLLPSAGVAGDAVPPDTSRFGESCRTLFRWKGSVYRLIWKHVLIYCACYLSLTFVHKFALDEQSRKGFEAVAGYCSQFIDSINIMIMLAFFTNTTLVRLFDMHTQIPGTGRLVASFVFSLRRGVPEARAAIEKFSRWTVVAWILTFRVVSKPLLKVYPNLKSLERAGLLKYNERLILEEYDDEDGAPSRLLVYDWLLLLMKDCLDENIFMDEASYHRAIEQILSFKKCCGNVIKFSTQNIPDALIQAVVVAVYIFGFITIMARDFSENKNETVRIVIEYVPFMPAIQFFIFYVWLAFGRAAVNPFGSDECDIDVVRLARAHVGNAARLRSLYTLRLADVLH